MNKFSKPPLTHKEKKKRAEAFLNFIECQNNTILNKNFKKEPVKTLYLRAPESFCNDIKEIMVLTGLSMNAVCLELLRPAIKRKLREIKNDLI